MTGHRSGDMGASEKQRFQFSLGALMLLVLGVAFALSAVSSKGVDWAYGLFAPVIVCITLGLVNQVRDLWTTFHARSDLSGDERWGWRFAALWRVGVACLLVGHYIVTALATREIMLLPARYGDFSEVGANLRRALLYLSLLIVVASVPSRTEKPRKSPQSRLLAVAGAILGLLWGFLIWTDQTAVFHLVHLALQGIEATWPAQFAIEGLEPDMTARSRAFFWRSLLGVGFVPVNLLLVQQLSRHWGRRLRLRLILGGFLTLSLAMTAWYPIWVYTSGLRKTSPMMAQAMDMGPLHLWISALLLVVVVVTTATYRMVGAPGTPLRTDQPNWRRNPRSYYHERPGVILLLVGAVIVGCTGDLVPRWRHMQRLANALGVSLGLKSYLSLGRSFMKSFLYDPVRYMSLAVLLVALWKAWTGWSQSPDLRRVGPPMLPVAPFCAIWLAMFLTAITGIPTIAWFSVAIWMCPW